MGSLTLLISPSDSLRSLCSWQTQSGGSVSQGIVTATGTSSHFSDTCRIFWFNSKIYVCPGSRSSKYKHPSTVMLRYIQGYSTGLWHAATLVALGPVKLNITREPHFSRDMMPGLRANIQDWTSAWNKTLDTYPLITHVGTVYQHLTQVEMGDVDKYCMDGL